MSYHLKCFYSHRESFVHDCSLWLHTSQCFWQSLSQNYGQKVLKKKVLIMTNIITTCSCNSQYHDRKKRHIYLEVHNTVGLQKNATTWNTLHLVGNQYQSLTTLGLDSASSGPPVLSCYASKLACFYPKSSSKISLPLYDGSLNCCSFFINLLYNVSIRNYQNHQYYYIIYL